MVRIVVTPTWAKLIDFETTLPSAVEELSSCAPCWTPASSTKPGCWSARSPLEEGAAFRRGGSGPDIEASAEAAVADLPAGLVYAGISAGVVHAQ